MEVTLNGILRKYEWEHADGSTQVAYLLELDEPKTFEVNDPFDLRE